MEACHGRVYEIVKGSKLVHIIPYFLVGCVEDMCTVLVDIDPVGIFRIDVAADMASFIDNETLEALFFQLISRYRTVQSGPDYQIIVSFSH